MLRYTANLASFLVVKKEASGAIKGIEDLVAGNHKVCAVPASLPSFHSAVPAAKALTVKVTCAAGSHHSGASL